MKINNAEGVGQFQPRVRALARTLGVALQKKRSTLKGLAAHMPNPFRVNYHLYFRTQGCRYAPTTGLKLANAFGVIEE